MLKTFVADRVVFVQVQAFQIGQVGEHGHGPIVDDRQISQVQSSEFGAFEGQHTVSAESLTA